MSIPRLGELAGFDTFSEHSYIVLDRQFDRQFDRQTGVQEVMLGFYAGHRWYFGWYSCSVFQIQDSPRHLARYLHGMLWRRRYRP